MYVCLYYNTCQYSVETRQLIMRMSSARQVLNPVVAYFSTGTSSRLRRSGTVTTATRRYQRQ